MIVRWIGLDIADYICITEPTDGFAATYKDKVGSSV